MNLSKDFTLAELTRSETADKHGIANTPDAKTIARLEVLARTILQPLRDFTLKPVHVNSGYRCEAVNSLVNGKPTSQHLRGEAADIIIEGVTPAGLVKIIDALKLPYHQLINEFDQWVHVSIAPAGEKPRHEIKRIS